jgi:hypothetical protein
LDPSVTDLQAQLDRLSLAVHRGREAQHHVEPLAQRLAHLTERCADILNRWSETDRRHAQAVSEVEARLNDWGAIESRLEQDAIERLRELQRAIGQEWETLRQMQEEPVRQLREHAAALGELAVSATSAAAQSFERAEARLAQLEAGINEQLAQLSRDLHIAIADVGREVARTAPLGPASNVEPFPLDSVMRIHEEVRLNRPAAGSGALAPALVEPHPRVEHAPDVPQAPEPDPARLLPEAAASLAARLDTLEKDVAEERHHAERAATETGRLRKEARLGVVLFAVGVVILAALGFILQRQLSARLDDADSRVAAAERQAQTATDLATRQVEATRAQAERDLAEARETARSAAVVSQVLAAPDLVRLNLIGAGAADRAAAQALFSRTRGLVLSASRMPAPPDGSVYQMWLLTATDPVSAGVFTPDAAGTVTMAIDAPSVPRAVIGAMVTVETAGGASAPSTNIVLQTRTAGS